MSGEGCKLEGHRTSHLRKIKSVSLQDVKFEDLRNRKKFPRLPEITARQPMSVIPALRRLRQREHHSFEAGGLP